MQTHLGFQDDYCGPLGVHQTIGIHISILTGVLRACRVQQVGTGKYWEIDSDEMEGRETEHFYLGVEITRHIHDTPYCQLGSRDMIETTPIIT